MTKRIITVLLAVLITGVQAFSQTAVKGTVTDATGAALPGVSVLVKGTSAGAVTDIDGAYSISGVKGESVLVFSFIGYQTVEETVGNRAIINVILTEDAELLQETVVVGFGTQKKVNLSGSISTVNVDKLTESRPITNISNALVGTAAGVNVTAGSEAPGSSNQKIIIRGQGTLNTSTPLVIIDGVEASISSVNPQDVESMTVLKDAASSAIYGSRAANGVILITTKKGKSGSVKVDYNGYASIESIRYPKNLTPVSNYADYMEYINEGYTNQGQAAKFSQATIDEWRSATESGADPLMYPNQNYLDATFHTGVAQNHVLSVTGGSDRIRIYSSFGYMNNPGVMDNSGETRYTGRVNVEADATKWLTVGTNVNGYVSKLDMGANPDISNIATTPGMTFQFPDGRFGGVENPEDDPQASNNNPIKNRYTTDGSDKTNNISARFYGTIKPFKGFSLTGSYTYQFSDRQRNVVPVWQDLYSYRTNSVVNSGTGRSYATNTDSKVIRKYGDVVAKYENSWVGNKLDFSVMAGGSTESYKSSSFSATRYDLIDMSLQALSAATGDMSCSGSSSGWAMNSFFGRLNLGWDSRYLLELNFRADASSRFTEKNRWGYFPSGSFAWRMSEEKWMKGSGVDNLKFRISYGGLGNNSVGNYQSQALYNIQNYVLGNSVAVGMAQTALANANLTWETTYVANFGIDFGFLKNRLTGTVDIFNKDTKDILIDLPAPAVHGTSSIPTQNAAEVRNRGVELTLGWQDTKGDFYYSINGNFTYVKNKVMKFKGDEYSLSGANYIREGYSINSQYLLRYDRIIQTEEDMKIVEDMLAANPDAFNAFGKPQYGDLLYKDINGDGLVNNDDKEVVSDGPNPKFYFGLNFACGWKGIDFSILFQGVAGVKQYWQDLIQCTSSIYYGNNITKDIAEGAWREGRTDATYPRLTTKEYTQNTQASDFYLEDLSYLKIRNIQLGYTLPQKWTSKIQLERVRFYASLENFFTFTSFRGFDPEVSGYAYPTLRQAVFGINITFGGKSNK